MQFRMMGKCGLVLFIIISLVVGMLPAASLSAADESVQDNLALGKTVIYSGVEGGLVGENWRYPQFVGEMAVDGSASTRWSADKVDEQWLVVDLGEVTTIGQVVIDFHAVSPDYEVLISEDGIDYVSVYNEVSEKQGSTELKTITFSPQSARYVKYVQNKQWRHTNNQYYGSSIRELEVYGEAQVSAQYALNEAEEQQLTLSEDGSRIILPAVHDNYEISLYGSDNRQVIALDGTVHQPLVGMDVNVLYKVVNKHDPSDFAMSEADIRISVPGRYVQENEDNPVPNVLPGLREWKGHTGQFVMTAGSKIVITDASLNETAETLQLYFKDMLNRDIEISAGPGQPGDILLALDDEQAVLGEEGYTLEIADNIVISSSEPKGVLYGGISVTQILYQDEERANVPKGLARDYPKYEVRAGMIDVGRMYIPLEYLQEMTIYMAWFKLNEIQVHVNDYWGGSGYSAFRLESEKYPQIVASDGYYSKEAYKQYQMDMKRYGVDVITEIDTPYHSEAFRSVPGVKMLGAGALDIRDENTVAFVLDLLDEYLDGEDPVIQSSKFHIGTDEYNKAYSEQMRAYTDLLIQHVNGKGYETRLWGSLGTRGFNGTTPVSNEATMNLWAPYWSDVREMYDAGYDIINTVGGWLYIVPGSNAGYPDRLNLASLYDSFDVNNFSPARRSGEGTAIMPVAHPQTKGAEFAIWNDMTSFGGGFSEFDIFDRMRDAVAITAEKTWYGEKTAGQTAEQFVARVEALYAVAGGSNPGRYVESNGDIIAEYTFEELDGDVVRDLSANGYDAVVVNGSLNDGSKGKGVSFAGNGYLSLPFDSVGFPYSVFFDVNLSDIPANTELFSGKEGTLFANFNGTGKLGFQRGELGISYEFVFDYELPDNEWVSIALVQELTYRNGSNDSNTSHSKLYVNGQSVGVAQSVVAPLNNRRYSTSFVLPTEKIMNGATGRIDQLKIINRTLGAEEIDQRDNLALNKPTETSSVYPGQDWVGAKAVDGIDDSADSRWGSKRATGTGSNEDSGQHGTREQWISVDLGNLYRLSEVYISWENAYATRFVLQGSLDGVEYADLKEVNGFGGGKISIRDIEDQAVRFIKISAKDPFNATWGYSIYEIKAYGELLVDKAELAERIAFALQRLEETEQGDEPGQYPEAARTMLAGAIEQAQNIADIQHASEEEINEAIESLNDAIAAYDAAVVKEPSSPDAVTAVADVVDVRVPQGTTAEDLLAQLPTTVEATLASGAIETAAVTWDVAGSEYDGEAVGEYTVTGTLSSGVYNPDELTASVKVIVVEPGELEPPVWPEGSALTASNVGRTGLTLTWTAAEDQDAVTGYNIYRGAQLVGTLEGDATTYAITGLSPGTTYTFKVEAGNELGQWTTDGPSITVTTERDSIPSNPDTPIVTPKPDPTDEPNVINVAKPQVGADGLAKASIDSEAYNKAAAGDNPVEIKVEAAPEASGYEVVLPPNALASGNKQKSVVIRTALGTIAATSDLLPSTSVLGAKEVSLSIAKAGQGTTVDIALKVDGKEQAWRSAESRLDVFLPYTPTDEELADAAFIIVWHMDEEGNATAVASGKYDAELEGITFQAGQTGRYSIQYVHKTFVDLEGYGWAKQSVEMMASRGIIKGTSAETYTPAAAIKRADFIALLVRTLGLKSAETGNFDDVAADAYYAADVAVAKALGIANGTGNNQFKPEQSISRQEMMILIDRALAQLGKSLEQGSASDLEGFNDLGDIADYARQSVANLVKSGLVKGKAGGIDPVGQATRAEIAVLIERLYDYVL